MRAHVEVDMVVRTKFSDVGLALKKAFWSGGKGIYYIYIAG